jgi:Calcium-binding EGF domain
VERVNQELDGVVDVEVEWNGSDLHGKVGDHFIQCKVTRLVNAIHQANTQVDTLKKDDHGRHVIVQCFTLSFTILDTNECTLQKDHPMHHNCHDSAICVNTIGSYECLCPKLGETTSKSLEADEHFWTKIKEEKRSGWELSYATPSKSSCPLSPSSFSCCSHSGHSLEGKACRKAFTCPTDPCVKSTCDPLAQCIRNENPLALPNHNCMCPSGLMGNGRLCGKRDLPPKPMVMYDGITPTEETVKNNYYCGCNKPEIDACAGFPPCQGVYYSLFLEKFFTTSVSLSLSL